MTQSCTGCGACCLGMGVPPFDDPHEDGTDPEFDVLPEPLKQEIIALMEEESWAFKPCLWFDRETRRCRHYELRPTTCKVFKPGNPVCLDDRTIAMAKGFLSEA